jgi:hypothetical protein
MSNSEALKKHLIDENEYRSNKRRLSSKEGDIHITGCPLNKKQKRLPILACCGDMFSEVLTKTEACQCEDGPVKPLSKVFRRRSEEL